MNNGKDRIVLGEYELVGKNRHGDFHELVLKPPDWETGLGTMRFDKGAKSSILIKDKVLAKTIHDGDVFRIILERVEKPHE